jgi:two-component system sensor histidine kinase PilS (NtrC family)
VLTFYRSKSSLETKFYGNRTGTNIGSVVKQIMTENSNFPDYLTSRIRWLMLSKVIIISFLLATTTFVEIKQMEALLAISSAILFKTILLAYSLSLLFIGLLKYIRNISLNIYIQSLCDIALITAMVYATGGIHSIYSIFYPLVIIYSVLFLGKRGGLIVASVAGIFYGLLTHLEFYRVIYLQLYVFVPAYNLSTGDVLTRIITHILSFYLIAFLASFVVEQERKVRNLLVEKQSAFDQLDLLHRSIIESVDNGIVTVNLNGQIKSFNRAAVKITGFAFRDVENHYFSEVFPDGPFLGGIKIATQNIPMTETHFEILFSTSSGERLVIGGSVSPLKDSHGTMIGNIVVFQDLTEINQMKKSLEKSQQLALIGEIAANLAHEIRNPLASIGGSIQMLKGGMAQDKTNARLMQIILRGKDHLESFLKDFLLMARPALGAREEIDIRETIKESIESLRYVADWHELLDVVMVLTDEPLYIRANKTEIRQILWNLMLNAIQSMPDGGVLKVEARPARAGERDGAEISISDTGCGIEELQFSKIFDPFYTTRDAGTGLGLAVVNRILEAYGGKIHIQSEPGEGSIFTVWLPLRVAVSTVAGS